MRNFPLSLATSSPLPYHSIEENGAIRANAFINSLNDRLRFYFCNCNQFALVIMFVLDFSHYHRYFSKEYPRTWHCLFAFEYNGMQMEKETRNSNMRRNSKKVGDQ